MDTEGRDPTDEALMQALAQGDDAALAPLMSRWEMPMRRYLYRLLLNAAEAEDLAQETFVRLYTHRATFDLTARFSPFLYTIASNLAKNRLRWRSVRKLVSLQAPTANETEHEFPDASAATGAERAETAERAEAVRAAVAALPAPLRTAIILAEYEGLSHEEIGRVLHCSAKAVESRLYRARAALREKLAAWLSRA